MKFPTIYEDRMINVLFLGPGNAGRSLMAEALLNQAGCGRFWAYSAGRAPAAGADPLAIETLRDAGIPCGGLWPKAWTRFARQGAPRMDLVVTLSPQIPVSAVPRLPGGPVIAAWAMGDTVPVQGGEEEQRHALRRLLRRLETNVIKLAGPVLTGRVPETPAPLEAVADACRPRAA